MDIHDLINNYLGRLKNGDACFEEFFGAASWCVEYIADRYLIDKSFIDDVVVNTFDRIAGNIHKFDGNGNGYAWICKIAQNEALKINRREDRPEISLRSLEQVATKEKGVSPEESLDIGRALNELDPADVQLFESKYLLGKSVADIAEELNVSIGTVTNRLKRIYKALYKKLSKR